MFTFTCSKTVCRYLRKDFSLYLGKLYVHKCVHTYTHLYMYVNVCIYTYAFIYIHMCTHAYAYIYIHDGCRLIQRVWPTLRSLIHGFSSVLVQWLLKPGSDLHVYYTRGKLNCSVQSLVNFVQVTHGVYTTDETGEVYAV